VERIPKNMRSKSEDELKEMAMTSPNGNYVTLICRRCGRIAVDPDGSTDSANIVDECVECEHVM